MERFPINSPKYGLHINGFSHMLVVPMDGTLLFVSGVTARDEGSAIVGVGSMDAQARQVLINIEAILAEAGASLVDIVQIRTFVTDISRWREIDLVWRQYWPGDWPASTLVQVERLFDEQQLIEMEAVAVLPRPLTRGGIGDNDE